MKIASMYYNDPYFVREGDTHVHIPYERDNAVVWDHLDKEKPDLVVLWGGEDISPSIYNEHPTLYTNASHKKSSRDIFELTALKWAETKRVPVVGVCRGLQLMSCYYGLSLYQHVMHHTSSHSMHLLEENRTIPTSSLHHQMVNVQYLRGTTGARKIRYKVLALSEKKATDAFTFHGKANIKYEPEAIRFWNDSTLLGFGVQGHPEYLPKTSELSTWVFSLIDSLKEAEIPKESIEEESYATLLSHYAEAKAEGTHVWVNAMFPPNQVSNL